MMSESVVLSEFVRQALGKGQSKAQVQALLLDAGWTQIEVEAALAAWEAHPDLGAVPQPVRSRSAWDALFYAVLFVAFWMVIGNTLALLFGQIEAWFPEPGETYRTYMLSGQRWSMAALIVFTPVFFWINRIDVRACAADPARPFGTLRRWLATVALFVAAVSLMGNALYLIYRFLDGDITAKFMAKTLVVAAASGLVLFYFLQDRRERADGGRALAGWLPVASALAVLVLSFLTIGGPGQGQMERRDAWRISDMYDLRGDIANCEGVDPENLPEALNPMDCARNPDSLTGFAASVRYERLSSDRFRLCTEIEDPERVHRTSGATLDGATYCLD